MIIEKTATESQNFFQAVRTYGSAREGMSAFLEWRKRDGLHDRILLPGWIGHSDREGSGVFDPIRASAIAYGFYGLRDDLTCDPRSIEKELGRGDYTCVLLIHYFGRTDPSVQEVRRICDKYGVLLIEDLAHTYYSYMRGAEAGRTGDVCLFSMHKVLPLHDGGMFIYRNPSLAPPQTPEQTDLAISTLSYDWASISARRRDNYVRLSAALRQASEFGLKFELVWETLEKSDVPHTMPIFMSHAARDETYFSLNNKGMGVVSLYHTLIPEIDSDLVDLQILSKRIINLPVHQDATPEDMDQLAEAFLAEVRGRS